MNAGINVDRLREIEDELDDDVLTDMTDGDTGDGYNVGTAPHATAYDQGWRDGLDSFARHLDRLAARFDRAARQP